MTKVMRLGVTGFLALAFGIFPADNPDAVADSITFEAMVIDVQDGDTLIVASRSVRKPSGMRPNWSRDRS
jgi:hypothetical protein